MTLLRRPLLKSQLPVGAVEEAAAEEPVALEEAAEVSVEEPVASWRC